MMLAQLAGVAKDVSVIKRLTFATSFYPKSMPNYWEHVTYFSALKKEARCQLSPATTKLLMENMTELDGDAFVADEDLVKEITAVRYPGNDAHIGVVLVSSKERCQLCDKSLYIRKDRCSKITLYDDQRGTLPATHYIKYCRNSKCSLQQYYGFYTRGSVGEVYYDKDWASLPFFMSSRETAFTMKMMQRLDTEILIGQLSYKQRADIYNHIHEVENTQDSERVYIEREKLDRRRLLEAHFKYAILTVTSWYPEFFREPLVFLSNIYDTLSHVTPEFQKAFHIHYSAHRCNCKGCGTVLVVDGNMKNNREVCSAADAGYIEYAGLPGSVKTGCTETPERKSKFCSLHKPRSLLTAEKKSSGRVIESILASKQTRTNMFYQVLWLGCEDCTVTWESAEDVPKHIIDEYISNTRFHVDDLSSGCKSRFGQQTHTLSVTSNPTSTTQRPVVKENTGVFESNPEDRDCLNCNTEKDKATIHDRTAGIVAGMWPCGTISFIDELFRSESKAQVYGSLHTYFYTNPVSTKDISFLCYDDACHLKKFATNPQRSTLTDVATVISGLNIVVDKMHFAGHVDPWCHANCNPHNFEELKEVNTEVCEQTFSWLSRYARISRHMNKGHFLFYILYLCEHHNRKLNK